MPWTVAVNIDSNEKLFNMGVLIRSDIVVTDHIKRYRLLAELKSNQEPVRRWDRSSVASPARVRSGADAEPNVIAGPSPQCRPQSSRAQGKTGAVWKGNTTYKFLQVCAPFRKWVRPKIVPEPMWQILSDKLYYGPDNLDYSWEQLKEKIRNLKSSFKKAKDRITKNGSIIGKWCFSPDLLYDQQSNCELTATEGFGSASQSGPPIGPFQPSSATSVVGSTYSPPGFLNLLTSSANIHDIPLDFVMPPEVSLPTSSPAMVPHNVTATGKQCRDKFRDLKTRYNIDYDECHNTRASPSVWPYFKEMNALFGNTAAMKPPLTMSLGTSSNYKVKDGSKSQPSQSGSRTRVSSESEPAKKDKKPPAGTSSKTKATFKSRTVEAQETRVHQQDRLIQQMEQMHETYASQCEVQNELLRMLIAKATESWQVSLLDFQSSIEAVPYVNYRSDRCLFMTTRIPQVYITPDRFCTGPVQVSNLTRVGAGFFVRKRDSWFLHGILSFNFWKDDFGKDDSLRWVITDLNDDGVKLWLREKIATKSSDQGVPTTARKLNKCGQADSSLRGLTPGRSQLGHMSWSVLVYFKKAGRKADMFPGVLVRDDVIITDSPKPGTGFMTLIGDSWYLRGIYYSGRNVTDLANVSVRTWVQKTFKAIVQDSTPFSI
ncbi:hypothetical protein FOCC_FOCC014594 [Frankliniella occidentalis]|nr:hypothetical protein FOCC_FOCC014594 [Frankliniella occidentalis]